MKKFLVAMAVCAMFVACGGGENKDAKKDEQKPVKTKTVEQRAEEYVERIQNASTVGEIWKIQEEAEQWMKGLSPENQAKADRIFQMNSY